MERRDKIAASGLKKRLISATILLPMAIGAILAGFPFFELLVAGFSAVMAWEWSHICNHKAEKADALAPSHAWGTIYAAFCASLVLYFSIEPMEPIGAMALIIGVASIVTMIAMRTLKWAALWIGAGTIYVTLPCYAMIWLRRDPALGPGIVLWIVALTAAADSAAYFAGRGIGGPRLAPRISPNKTWAGFAGAVLGAAIAGFLASFWLTPRFLWSFTLSSAMLGAIGQGGDLVESAFKRHFGVKDSGTLIPGHGGVLDRVDGLLAVAIGVMAIRFFGER